MRLKVSSSGLRTYPDVNVYCEEMRYDPEDPELTTAINPTMVVEVSSPSTQAYDRAFKAQHYRTVESLRAYAFVAQDRPHVELYQREPSKKWSLTEASGLESTIRIDAIGVELRLAEIYASVKFPPVVPPPLPRP
jgi:Uma2 family endonuclease